MNRIILAFVLMAIAAPSFAQRKVRQATREGNDLYHKEDYLNAEIQYRTALDGNASDSLALYNLGNALFRQQQDEKAQEALRHYISAADAAQKGGNHQLAAKAYFNAGDVCMAASQYQQAVQFFKRSLRNNPLDDEARYNLFLAQKLLEQQQQQQQDQDDNKQDQDQQQDQKQQQPDDQNQQQDKPKDQDQQEQPQDQQPQDDQQQEQQQQQQQQQMSQDQAEAILNANNRDEQDTQEKVQQRQMQQMQRRKTDKDW